MSLRPALSRFFCSFSLSVLLFLFFVAGCSCEEGKIELTGQVEQTLSAGMKSSYPVIIPTDIRTPYSLPPPLDFYNEYPADKQAIQALRKDVWRSPRPVPLKKKIDFIIRYAILIHD